MNHSYFFSPEYRKQTESLESGFSRETEPTRHVYRDKEIYFKELAHAMVETGRSKLCRVSQQAGDTGRASGARSLKTILQWILFFGGRLVFLFLYCLPTLPRAICFIRSTSLNIYLIQNPLTETLGYCLLKYLGTSSPSQVVTQN